MADKPASNPAPKASSNKPAPSSATQSKPAPSNAHSKTASNTTSKVASKRASNPQNKPARQMRQQQPKRKPPAFARTFAANRNAVEVDTHLIDAKDLVLGRLAAFVASLLQGKHKPIYTPHTNCGDKVIVINCGKIALSGNKLRNKIYYRHTGYPGGIRQTTPIETLEGGNPSLVVRNAIKGMLKHSPLGRQQLRNLRTYPDDKHPYQDFQILDFAAKNRKNTLGA